MAILKRYIKSILSAAGLDVRKKSNVNRYRFPVELNEEEKKILSYVAERKITMTSYERLATTLMACKHVIERGIEGSFVECGVWRGGNAIVAAATFKLYKCQRRVYLFDTFEGMTVPTDEDSAIDGTPARDTFEEHKTSTHNEWCYASLDEVKNNFAEAGLLSENVMFVKGDVIEALDDAQNLPERVSVLRLDTDWYASTKKELEVLYPRLSIGGVLMIDDYGHWTGSKKATDEYFASIKKRPFLQYIDYTGRVGIKFD